jgi:D-serine deaminase-like pyridoxal phosphate-dependent protein
VCAGAGFVCELIVSHCDPTINLHEVIFVTEKDVVVDIYPVDGRGKHF